MKRSSKIILIVILLIGFLLRVININSSPPALYGDELTIGLDANSLLHTGLDQLGNAYPLTFEMGAGRPAGYVYASIPFVALFGVSPIGIRGLSIFSGLGIILLMFYMGRRFFSERIGLIASFITSISIWDISLSRGGFEAHFALFVALLGTYFFIKASEKPFLYIFSALCFGLTLHTYPTYKVTLILFLPLLFWYQEGFKNSIIRSKRYFLGGVVLFSILVVIALSQTFVGGSEDRFSRINILSQENLNIYIEQKVNLERDISQLPKSISKYFHNKYVEYTKVFIENYLQNFSADFLILHGDRNPRHNMATMGQLYLAQILLVIIAFISTRIKEKRLFIFLIAWILVTPIATSVVDLPHALRSAFMLPPILILSALGLSVLLDQKKKIILEFVVILFFIQFIFFIQKLYFLAPNEYSNFWAYQARIASEIAAQNKNNFDYIVLSDKIDSIEFAYPAYAKVEPIQVIGQNKNKTNFMSYQTKNFENIYIGNFPGDRAKNLMSELEGSILYIGLPEESVNFTNYQILQGLDKKQLLLLVKKEK